MTETRHYQKVTTISDCDCDFGRRLTVGGFLREVQTLGTYHAGLLGATYERHRDTHTAFVLAKTSILLARAVPPGETVTLDTYPSSAMRAVFHRYTTLRLPDGSLAGAVDARWVLVDTEQKRILRSAPEGLGLSLDGAGVVAEHDLRFPKPDALAELGKETATYSRCDQNLHLNNTYYGDIVCDHIPLDAFREDFVRRVVIVYRRELPMGQSVTLSGGQPSPGDYYFSGDRDGQNFFEAFASFAPVEIPEPAL